MLQRRSIARSAPTTRSLLYPMIHISDNDAASAVLAIVGAGAVARVAREAGMSDYAPGVGWWAFTQTSAADQARFFFDARRASSRRASTATPATCCRRSSRRRAGASRRSRGPRWQVFFKTGALPSQGLFNEVARLERAGVTFTVAVFTDGDPSMAYGEQTIEGVAARAAGAARHERRSSPRERPQPRASRRGLLVLHHGRGTDEHDLLPLADVLDPRRAAARRHAARAADAARARRLPLVSRAARRATPTRTLSTPRSTRSPSSTTSCGSGPASAPSARCSAASRWAAVMSYALGPRRRRARRRRASSPSRASCPASSGWSPTSPARRGLPVFIAHGTRDAVIDVELRARSARDAAERRRPRGRATTSPRPAHHIDPRAAAAGGEWLARRSPRRRSLVRSSAARSA